MTPLKEFNSKLINVPEEDLSASNITNFFQIKCIANTIIDNNNNETDILQVGKVFTIGKLCVNSKDGEGLDENELSRLEEEERENVSQGADIHSIVAVAIGGFVILSCFFGLFWYIYKTD